MRTTYVANTSVLSYLTGKEVKILGSARCGGFWGYMARFPDGFVRFVYEEEITPKRYGGRPVRVLSAFGGAVLVRFADGTEQNVLRKELT